MSDCFRLQQAHFMASKKLLKDGLPSKRREKEGLNREI